MHWAFPKYLDQDQSALRARPATIGPVIGLIQINTAFRDQGSTATPK
jgi:hypothetical protein